MNRLALTVLVALATGLAGCGREEPAAPDATIPDETPAAGAPAAPAPAESAAAVSVTDISVGNAIGSDKRVTAGSQTLAPNDTIYVSVDTSGSGSATLKATWTYLGEGGETTVVNEETQTIDPIGPATTEFHISKPDGFPPGEYQVEVFVNDVPAGSRRFTVKG
jgi:predicted small lipoprotein YifL